MSESQIRYTRLAYVCLNVADIQASTQFYEKIVGLELVDADAERAYLRCSDRYFDIMLVASPNPGLKRIGWQMESPAARTALREKLAATGHHITELSPAESKALHVDGGFSTWEPTTGARLDFFCEIASAGKPFTPTHTKIARLGHLVIATTDLKACDAFFEDILNFKASDRIGEVVVHLRCFPNPLHHSFGIGAAPEARLHHLNFMVTEYDDIGKANVRMQANDVPIVFGPGRHPQSNSYFFYFLDPDGMTLEYSFGMEEFPEVDPRGARDFPLTVESGDYWGGTPKPGFAAKGRIECADAI